MRCLPAAAAAAVLITAAPLTPLPASAESGEELTRLTRQAAALLEKPELGVTDWARASYLAVRIFAYQARAVPHMQQQFAAARSPANAFLAGSYVAIYGHDDNRAAIRKTLESDPQKRIWLTELVGDARALSAALRAGEKWRPAIDLLPSPAGCRNLVVQMLQSRDPLLRRAGLLWGYWIADGLYWRRVRIAASSDPDLLTRRFAALLLKKRSDG